ncbi:hypothetical protein [Sphingorhabdus contaminans]|uniref:hypothetical protein n=1 Tax=Sphingorhabdus contaminans TaxID=1343899 RepID=UPI003D2988F4
MATFAQSQTFPQITASPLRRRTNWTAWINLFFGPAPLWWRVMFWAQRNKAA